MRVFIVTGRPCSGKTTYVRNNIKQNDIVFDFDEIARALTYSKWHTVNKENVKPLVMQLRHAFINSLWDSKPLGDVWIIASNLTDYLLKITKRYEPDIITIDTSEEECIRRLHLDETRPDKDEWERVIREWG